MYDNLEENFAKQFNDVLIANIQVTNIRNSFFGFRNCFLDALGCTIKSHLQHYVQ